MTGKTSDPWCILPRVTNYGSETCVKMHPEPVFKNPRNSYRVDLIASQLFPLIQCGIHEKMEDFSKRVDSLWTLYSFIITFSKLFCFCLSLWVNFLLQDPMTGKTTDPCCILPGVTNYGSEPCIKTHPEPTFKIIRWIIPVISAESIFLRVDSFLWYSAVFMKKGRIFQKE